MVGHSTGGCEVARFLGRHGTKRVSKAVLVSATAPGLLKTKANPDGVGMDVFDSFRDSMVKDRAQFFIDIPSGPFFGFNRKDANVSQGLIWNWYKQGMTCGFKAAFDCIKAFSETDTSEDVKNADIPILVCAPQIQVEANRTGAAWDRRPGSTHRRYWKAIGENGQERHHQGVSRRSARFANDLCRRG